jgi:cell division protein FtsA
MGKEELICSLDFGSSQITGVVGYVNDKKEIEIIAGHQERCPGVRNGAVVNLSETTLGVRNLIDNLSKKVGEQIDSVYIAIRGKYIKGLTYEGAINITRNDKVITEEDVEEVFQTVNTLKIEPTETIMRIEKQDFKVDGQPYIDDPIGMEGTHLAAQLYVIIVSQTFLHNIIKAVLNADVKVIDVMYGVLSTVEAVLTRDEYNLGVVVIDMGGDTTEICTIERGKIVDARSLPLGGEMLTRDIAWILQTLTETAKMLKEKYGVLVEDVVEDLDEPIPYRSIDGRLQKTTTRRKIMDILTAETEKIFGCLLEMFKRMWNKKEIPAGVVLTGGSAGLVGIDQIASKVLNMNVRIGLPIGVVGVEEIINNPSYTTAIGTIKSVVNAHPFSQSFFSHPKITDMGDIFSWILRKLKIRK